MNLTCELLTCCASYAGWLWIRFIIKISRYCPSRVGFRVIFTGQFVFCDLDKNYKSQFYIRKILYFIDLSFQLFLRPTTSICRSDVMDKVEKETEKMNDKIYTIISDNRHPPRRRHRHLATDKRFLVVQGGLKSNEREFHAS